MEQEQSKSIPRSGANVENQRQKYKKILKRIGKFQHYLNEMCHVITNHAVKAAGLRDKNDELAKCLDNFTKIEEFSTTSKLSMAVAAELVASVGDHQDLAVQRVETLVVPNLSSYGRICDCIKADVGNAIQAIKREKAKKKTVNTLKRKSSDPKIKKALDDATRDFERASAETSRLCQLSQEQVLKFEHKRLMDLKESLGNFVRIQIATHTKSLELLSQTYKHIQSIDEEGDLEILKSKLHIGGGLKRKSTATLKSKKSDKVTKSNSKLAQEKDQDSCSEVDSTMFKCSSDSSLSQSQSLVVRRLESVLNSRHDCDAKKRSKRKDDKQRSEREDRKTRAERQDGKKRSKRQDDKKWSTRQNDHQWNKHKDAKKWSKRQDDIKPTKEKWQCSHSSRGSKNRRLSESSHSSHSSLNDTILHTRKTGSPRPSPRTKEYRSFSHFENKNDPGSYIYVPNETITVSPVRQQTQTLFLPVKSSLRKYC